MAKVTRLTLTLDLWHDRTDEINANEGGDWIRDGKISIDNDYLEVDDVDDSFYRFGFVKAETVSDVD